MDAPPSKPPMSKARIFLRRLISSLILWTVVLTALFSSNKELSDYVFLLIMVFLAATGLIEFYGLVHKRDLVCFTGWGIFGGILLMVGTFLNLTGRLGTTGTPARVNDFETSFLILFVLGLCVRQFVARNNTTGILTISTTLFGSTAPIISAWLVAKTGNPVSIAWYLIIANIVTILALLALHPRREDEMLD